jgi:hypothetical protein
MKKYYLILVFICVVFTGFVCNNAMAKDRSDTIDISKIEINEVSVHDFSFSLLISHIQNIANNNLSKSNRSIKFWIQAEGKSQKDRLYWKGNKLYNQKNEEFDTGRKSIYSKVLTEWYSVDFKSESLDKILTAICKMSYLKYRQNGYNILLIIPQDWSEKINSEKLTFEQENETVEKCFSSLKKSDSNYSASNMYFVVLRLLYVWKQEKLSKQQRQIVNNVAKRVASYAQKRWGKYPPRYFKTKLKFKLLSTKHNSYDQYFYTNSRSYSDFIHGGYKIQTFEPTDINEENVAQYIAEIKKLNIRKIRIPCKISQGTFDKLMKGINVDYLTCYSGNINDISSIAESKRLRHLSLLINENMKGLEMLSKLPNLEILELESNRFIIKDLMFSGKISSLRVLKMSDSNIKSLSGLKNFPNLEELVITGTEIEEDLSPIANARKLKKFKLIFNSYPHEGKDITPLGSLSELKELALGIDINDITPLANLQNLEKLSLIIRQSTDLSPISKLRKLRAICPPYWIKDLRFLEKSSNLEHLHLAGSQVEDISSITKLKKLKKLNLWYCDKIKDYNPVGDLENLQILYLTALNIKKLDFLAKLKKLQSLHMLGNRTIKDFTSLTKLTHLKELVIDAFEYLDDSNKEMLVKSLPKCSIEFGGICFCVEGQKYLPFE